MPEVSDEACALWMALTEEAAEFFGSKADRDFPDIEACRRKWGQYVGWVNEHPGRCDSAVASCVHCTVETTRAEVLAALNLTWFADIEEAARAVGFEARGRGSRDRAGSPQGGQ